MWGTHLAVVLAVPVGQVVPRLDVQQRLQPTGVVADDGAVLVLHRGTHLHRVGARLCPRGVVSEHGRMNMVV